MDKKKIKELIIQAEILFDEALRNGGIDVYKNRLRAEHCFKDAIEELSKSDWISVEDRLPEFGEYVYTRITNIDGAAIYPVTKREKDGESILVRDYHKFVVSNMGCSVTHWKPIEKLEE